MTTARLPVEAVEPPGNRLRRHSLSRFMYGAIGFAVVAVLFELAPRVGLVSPLYLPPFSDVMSELWRQVLGAALWEAVRQTLEAMMLGLLIAVPPAVSLGLIVGSSPVLIKATSVVTEFLRTIPSVALIPLAVLLYGTSVGSSLLLIVYASFWQVFIQMLYGAQDVDPVAKDTAIAFRFGRLAQLRYVTWPTCIPYAVTGVRLATAVALILAITAELVIGSPGLGREIAVAQGSGAVTAMYALLAMAGVLGVAINLVTRAWANRFLKWHVSVRDEPL